MFRKNKINKYALSDPKWDLVKDLATEKSKRGTKKNNNTREMLSACLFVTRHNIAWTELPEVFGVTSVQAKRYFGRLKKRNNWTTIVRLIEAYELGQKHLFRKYRMHLYQMTAASLIFSLAFSPFSVAFAAEGNNVQETVQKQEQVEENISENSNAKIHEGESETKDTEKEIVTEEKNVTPAGTSFELKELDKKDMVADQTEETKITKDQTKESSKEQKAPEIISTNELVQTLTETPVEEKNTSNEEQAVEKVSTDKAETDKEKKVDQKTVSKSSSAVETSHVTQEKGEAAQKAETQKEVVSEQGTTFSEKTITKKELPDDLKEQEQKQGEEQKQEAEAVVEGEVEKESLGEKITKVWKTLSGSKKTAETEQVEEVAQQPQVSSAADGKVLGVADTSVEENTDSLHEETIAETDVPTETKLESELAQTVDEIEVTEYVEVGDQEAIDEAVKKIKQQAESELRRGCLEFPDGSYYCIKGEDITENSVSSGIDKWLDIFKKKDESDEEIYFSVGGEERRISDINIEDRFPVRDISGRSIVWQSLINGRWQVFYFDESLSEPMQITNGSTNNMSPQVNGNQIVWQSWIENNWDIMLAERNEDTGDWVIRQLTNNDQPDMFPKIANGIITWQGFTGDAWQVFFYDLVSDSVRQLSEGPGKYENPRFQLVWDDRQPDGEVQTVGYDLSTGEIKRIDRRSGQDNNKNQNKTTPMEEAAVILINGEHSGQNRRE